MTQFSLIFINSLSKVTDKQNYFCNENIKIISNLVYRNIERKLLFLYFKKF